MLVAGVRGKRKRIHDVKCYGDVVKMYVMSMGPTKTIEIGLVDCRDELIGGN